MGLNRISWKHKTVRLTILRLAALPMGLNRISWKREFFPST